MVHKQTVGFYVGVAALVSILAVFAQRGRNADPRDDDRPNVVLIMLDTLRADRVEADRGGVPVMPNLRAFANDSRYFTRAISPCTWTRPAVASIFTGLNVDAHGVFFSAAPGEEGSTRSDVLPESVDTMAEVLAKAGFATIGIQTNPNLLPEYGFGRGFDDYVSHVNADADVVTSLALEKVRGTTGPYFLYVHYMDVHNPYAPEEKYRALFGPQPDLPKSDQYAVDNFMDYFWDHVNYMTGKSDEREFPPMGPAGQEEIHTLYDSEARFMDEELGRLLDFIERQDEHTLFIILSDHGEQLWEHGGLGHGLTLYEEELRVPLMVRGPGISPGRVDETVSTLEVLPTVADFLGLDRDPIWQAEEGLQLLKLEEPRFSQTRSSWESLNIHLETVVLNNMELILDSKTGEYELYDLAADPLERDNLAEMQTDRLVQLLALLDAHREANNTLRTGVVPSDPVYLDPDTLEELRSLGYPTGE
jgi:arylsulfatase A-like enzyme